MLLGNYKTYAQSTSKGGIRGLWDADTDQIIFGTHQIAYRVVDHDQTLFPHQIERTFTFLPYAQLSEFTLDNVVHATEAFYVPHGPKFERSVSFVVDISLHNLSAKPLEVRVFPWALLVGQQFYGQAETEVHAFIDGQRIVARNEQTGGERWWGASRTPHKSVVSLREQSLLHNMRRGTLDRQEQLDEVTPEQASWVSSRIFGAFEYRIPIAPGARESLRLAVVYHIDGHAKSAPVLENLLVDKRALHDTQEYFATRMADARILTPSPVINRGVVWAKANMLRIVKEYPLGWGSTNSPPSDILVSRDTSWFVHGYDYFWPEFSRNALEVFNDHVDENGQMIEYVRGVSGFKTAYELNINDDTPLHLVAMLHHYNATLDNAWVLENIDLIKRIADFMLTQRDENGLLFSKAQGQELYGISSWRNIIPNYVLDGAVTEINAEGVFAFEAAAMLCAVAEDRDGFAKYNDAGVKLREAMMRYLFNADTGAFVLNYDQHQNYQDNFTADEIFPVLFNVADPEQRKAILRRLSETDFVTPVGLRTISTADSWYFPSYGYGLLGGVWPDLTLWFVVALARNGDIPGAIHFLEAIYSTMEAGSERNTVPGEFGEWFDGGSLTNRGMYLSPWTGAKYLWAVCETVGGIDGYRTTGRPHIAPLVPANWRWVAAARLRWGGQRCTYVVDLEHKRIYSNVLDMSSDDPFECLYLGRDVSDEVITSPVEVGAFAFEDENGRVRIFACNSQDLSREVSLEFRGRTVAISMKPGDLREVSREFHVGP